MNAVVTVESKVAVTRRVADLDTFLAERLLEEYLPRAEAWCQEMGARLLEEVVEELESLADDLALKKMERKRLFGPPRTQAPRIDLAAVVAKLEDVTSETNSTAPTERATEELSTAAETPAPEPATPAEMQTPLETPREAESEWTVREKKARKARASKDKPEPRSVNAAPRQETAQSLLKWPETTLEVAADRVGQLIGQKGVNLQSVEAEHGVRIKVPKNGKVRRVVITGPTGEHVRKGLSALRAILDLANLDAMLEQIAEEEEAPKDPDFVEVRPKSKFTKKALVVHESQVPALLGKKGKTIRNIEDVSGARVSVAEESGSRREVFVSGPTEDSVAKAEEMIDAALPAYDEVIVRSWQVGTLIGFEGETIADIQKRTGARVSVPREGEVRTAIISGDTAEVVQQAKALVLDTLKWAVRPAKPLAKADPGHAGLPRGQGDTVRTSLTALKKR